MMTVFFDGIIYSFRMTAGFCMNLFLGFLLLPYPNY